jgi:hypothetical protein
MAKITYVPAEGESAAVTWGGKRFEANKAVDVDNPAIIAKARNNPQFKVAGDDKKQGKQQAEIAGTYTDANTGDEIELIRRSRNVYSGTGVPDVPRPAGPSTATQGSVALEAARPIPADPDSRFREVFGASREEVASGEYEGAPEYIGPEGTEGATAKRGGGRKAKR